MVENQLRFTRESRRDWEKLRGMGAVRVVGAVGGIRRNSEGLGEVGGTRRGGRDGVRAARARMGAVGVVRGMG